MAWDGAPPVRPMATASPSRKPDLKRLLIHEREPADRDRRFWPQRLLLGLGLMLYIGAFQPSGRFFGDGAVDTGAFDPMVTAAQAVLLLSGLIFIASHPERMFRQTLTVWPFWLFVGLVVASVLWSASPEHTVRRGVAYVTFMLFAAWTDAVFGFRRTVAALFASVIAVTVIGIALAGLAPDLGLDVGDYAGALRGVFLQKNAMGAATLMGVLAWSFLALDDRAFNRQRAALCGLLILAAVASRSTTSLVLDVVTVGATTVVLLARRSNVMSIAVTIGMTLAVISAGISVAVLDADTLFGLLGKDASFTGRTPIWEAIGRAIQKQPILGYGYYAFWIDGLPGPEQVWLDIGWKAPSAHNGLLEIALQLGLLGVGVVAIMIVWTVYLIVKCRSTAGRSIATWMPIFCLSYATLNFTESFLLATNTLTLFWAIAVLGMTGQLQARPPLKPTRTGPKLRPTTRPQPPGMDTPHEP